MKKLNYTWLAILFALVTSVSFTACSSSDDGGSSAPTETEVKSKLAGDWKVTHVSGEWQNEKQEIESGDKDMDNWLALKLNSDGTYSSLGYDSTSEAWYSLASSLPYKVTGNSLVLLDATNKEAQAFSIQSIDDKTMTAVLTTTVDGKSHTSTVTLTKTDITPDTPSESAVKRLLSGIWKATKISGTWLDADGKEKTGEENIENKVGFNFEAGYYYNFTSLLYSSDKEIWESATTGYTYSVSGNVITVLNQDKKQVLTYKVTYISATQVKLETTDTVDGKSYTSTITMVKDDTIKPDAPTEEVVKSRIAGTWLVTKIVSEAEGEEGEVIESGSIRFSFDAAYKFTKSEYDKQSGEWVAATTIRTYKVVGNTVAIYTEDGGELLDGYTVNYITDKAARFNQTVTRVDGKKVKVAYVLSRI